MMEQDLLLMIEDDVSADTSADVRRFLPGSPSTIDDEPYDGDLGLRTILDEPELLAKAWRSNDNARPRRPRRRRPRDLRAA